VAAGGLAVVAAVLVWLVGMFEQEEPTVTTIAPPTSTTTSTSAGPTTTLAADDRLEAARLFWAALGEGDAPAAVAAFPATTPAAADLIGFAAAFRPGFTVGECTPFAANAAACAVAVTNGDLLAIGTGTPEQVLLVADNGWFDVPTLLGSTAARLSLYALENHTDEVRAACPLTDSPQVYRLPIVGSATPGCGSYLAGLVPEYLSAVLHQGAGPRE